jgi:trk system potassium uptake protein TrkH
MSYVPLLRFFGFTLLAIAAASVAPILAASVAGEDPSAYIASLCLSGFVSALLFVLSQGLKPGRSVRSGFRELILALSVFWVIGPFAACVPFVGQSLSLPSAWFEAVSALTTTGAWLSEPLARATASGMIYRASLEWLGGIASLATAAAVFVRPEFIGIAPPVPPFARGQGDTYLRAFTAAFETFFPVYAALTAVSFFGFIFAQVPVEQAITLALSLIASGGFAPTPGGISAYGVPAMVVAYSTLVVSAVNFIVIARLAIRGSGRLETGPDAETRAFLLLIVPVALLFWFSLEGWDIRQIPPQIGNAVSLLSTNGTIIGQTPQLTPLLVTATIGGAAVSTAGGIKLLRWLITFQRAGQELWQLTHPAGVLYRKRPALHEFGVWIHTIAFTIVLAALTLTVGFFGYDLELAVATAVAVVTNAGPLIAAAPSSTSDFIQFAEPLRILLALGMIAGRLELIVLMLIVAPTFWRA